MGAEGLGGAAGRPNLEPRQLPRRGQRGVPQPWPDEAAEHPGRGTGVASTGRLARELLSTGRAHGNSPPTKLVHKPLYPSLLRFRPRLRRGRVCTVDLLYESLVNFRYILVDRYSLPFRSTSGGRDRAIPGCAMQGLERNQGEDTKESMQTPVL